MLNIEQKNVWLILIMLNVILELDAIFFIIKNIKELIINGNRLRKTIDVYFMKSRLSQKFVTPLEIKNDM